MLNQERQQSSFPLEEMAHIIYGTKKRYETFIDNQKFYDSQPIFKTDFDSPNKSRQDQILKAADQAIAQSQQYRIYDFDQFDSTILCSPSVALTSVHQGMVIPAFEILASEKQNKEWMPLLKNFQAVGCYAQTELGHGSDVQNLLTTATYDQSTHEFIIHTPCVEATKFWPGELGLYCKFALVYAQLIGSNGKNQGVHPFWVRIRDQVTHKPLPNVECGDIGPKLGYVTKDNGYLRFNNYRASKESLLARFIKIDKEGQVQQRGNPKIGYASMMIVRNTLQSIYTRYAGVALTISIRYSLYRSQFKDSQDKEIKVLDYQAQQNKLFPILAEYYASIFGGLKVNQMVQDNFKLVNSKSDFSLLGLTHAVLSGAKASYAYFVSNAVEWCRLSCGGHGFAHYSGLPSIYFDLTPNITLEGENTILNLQLARYLLKMLQYVQTKPEHVHSSFQFLGNEFGPLDDLTTLHGLRDAIALNCKELVIAASLKLISHPNLRESWDKKAGMDLVRAAQSFIPYFNFVQFIDVIENKSIKTKQALTNLALLYGTSYLLTNMFGLLLKNLISNEQIQYLQAQKEKLLNLIRPDAISLVECQGFSDNTLKTLIAPYDGDIYQNMYNFASKDNSLNKKDVANGIFHIKKMREINPKL